MHILPGVVLKGLRGKHGTELQDFLQHVPDFTLVRALAEVPLDQAAEVLRALSVERQSRVFARLPRHEQRVLLPALEKPLARQLFVSLRQDVQCDILGALPKSVQSVFLDALPSAERRSLLNLLGYAPDTVGGIMTGSVVTVRDEATVRDALARLREAARDPRQELDQVYVVDAAARLLGTASLRQLLIAEPDTPIRAALPSRIEFLYDYVDAEVASRQLLETGQRALPVVNRHGELVGTLTHEDASRYLHGESSADIYRLGATQPLEAPYLRTSLAGFLRKRAGWLLVLFATEATTGTILRSFADELQAVIALAFFIPLLIDTGGNVGAQSTTLIVRGLALGELRPGHLLVVLAKELAVGAGLAGIMALAAIVRALTLMSPPGLVITVALSIFLLTLLAAVVGALLPLIIRRVGLDPSVVSAPFITTILDPTGILLYLLVARAILGL